MSTPPRLRLMTRFAILVAVGLVAACPPSRHPAVVVYAAQDQVYAERVLRDFERASGCRVKALYDSEAVKTVGLANRLLAERAQPQADLFWGNEELRTRQLAAQDVFRRTNGWVAFGYRSRRIVANTNRVALAQAPRTLADLTQPVWRGKVALAYPLFGTTATHFLALRQFWGQARWEAWSRALRANQAFLLDGNSLVVQFVGRGEAWVGLTDSDDVAAGQREGYPIAAQPLTEESLLIPNTIAVIRGAPHPEAAQQLFDFLQRREVARTLVEAGALEGVAAPELGQPTLQPDWTSLLEDLAPATRTLKEIFLR